MPGREVLRSIMPSLGGASDVATFFSIKSALLLKSIKLTPGLCIAKMHTAQNQVMFK
jgi:hypothetical protein